MWIGQRLAQNAGEIGQRRVAHPPARTAAHPPQLSHKEHCLRLEGQAALITHVGTSFLSPTCAADDLCPFRPTLGFVVRRCPS